MIVNGLGLGSFVRRSGSGTSTRASSAPTLPTSSKMDYVKLQPRVGSTFPPPHRTQLPPRFHSSLNSATVPTGAARSACHRHCWLIIPALILLFAFFCIYSFFKAANPIPREHNYGIIIDAGSSGSRLHVFRYSAEGKMPTVDTAGRDGLSLKTKPGLSSFATSPDKAGSSLLKLLDFARKKVPQEERSRTRLYLMATAGLRLLDLKTQESILDSCREVLQRSGFLFKNEWASVITGTDEGLFAWVAANYALGTLGGDPDETTGIVELGGASIQVTFVPKSSPSEESLIKLEIGGVTYKLYTYSFLNFGQEAAWQALLQLIFTGAVKTSLQSESAGVVVDPCTPPGYVMSKEDLQRHSTQFGTTSQLNIASVLSAGNFSECRRAAFQLLQIGHDKCLHERCAIGSTFIPELRGHFFATENFFYTSEFFGLPSKTSLAEVEAAGQHYCGEPWSKLQEVHKGLGQEDLLKYCFSTAYIVALLHDSLGITMHDDRMHFTNRVGNVPLDWPLGALTVKLAQENHQRPLFARFRDRFTTIFSFLGIFLLIGTAVWLIFRYQRPRLKTIYDLEKGRYITTTARIHR